MSARARLIPRWFWAAALTVALGASCHRRPAGSCELDVDCRAAFDCLAGRCVRRAPLPTDRAPRAEPAARPDVLADPDPAHAPADPAPELAPAAPLPRELPPPVAPAATPEPSPTSPSDIPTAPPRLPAWKVRLQNT